MHGGSGRAASAGGLRGNVNPVSSIRVLAGQLAARSDAELRQLFSARPDLCLPPVPDFSALAARACTRISLQRVLENLSRPELEVLEAVVLSTDVDAGLAADARSLRPLLVPPADAPDRQDLDTYLDRLRELALLVRVELPPSGNNAFPADDGGGLLPTASYLPVASLAEALGPYPGRTGPQLRRLGRLQHEAADHLVRTVRLLHEAGHESPATVPESAGMNAPTQRQPRRPPPSTAGWPTRGPGRP